MLKGYVHVNDDEAFFVDYIEVVEKKDVIPPYDEYIGYMEVGNAIYAVYNSAEGGYIAYKYDE